MKMLKVLLSNKRGQGLSEYMILMVLVVLTSITVVKTLGSRIKSKIESTSDHINSQVLIPPKE